MWNFPKNVIIVMLFSVIWWNATFSSVMLYYWAFSKKKCNILTFWRKWNIWPTKRKICWKYATFDKKYRIFIKNAPFVRKSEYLTKFDFNWQCYNNFMKCCYNDITLEIKCGIFIKMHHLQENWNIWQKKSKI